MLNNRKLRMLVAITLIVIGLVVTISAVNADPNPRAAKNNGLATTDFHQRHPEWASSIQNIVVPVTGASENLDYYQRHSGQRGATISPIDECFDVSLMEAASCRNGSQAPAQ